MKVRNMETNSTAGYASSQMYASAVSGCANRTSPSVRRVSSQNQKETFFIKSFFWQKNFTEKFLYKLAFKRSIKQSNPKY